MNWNIAQAKQRFSELVREAQTAPQLIYNRDTPVAAMIAAEELAEYEAWKAARAKTRTLGEEMAELRQILIEEGIADGLDIPPRGMRPNAFVQMLDEEYPELSADSTRNPSQ